MTRLLVVFCCLICALLQASNALGAETVGESGAVLNPQPEALPTDLPDLRKTMVLCQEWHTWFYSGTDAAGQEVRWWGDHGWQESNQPSYGDPDPYHPVGPLWWRANTSQVYPYIGPYDASNPEIIRWQVRLMKAAGLDGTLVHVYPLPPAGESTTNFAVIERCFQIAAEEGYRLGLHDEIQFMPEKMQGVDAFVERATALLRMMQKYPAAMLTVNGMPVYQFESFTMRGWTPERYQEMMQRVEKNIGSKVFWMSAGPAERLVQIPAFQCLKWPADVVFIGENQQTPNQFGYGGSKWTSDAKGEALQKQKAEKWDQVLAEYSRMAREAGKKWAPWVYPGFDCDGRYLSRENGAHLVRTIQAVMKYQPDLINIAAWNERKERSWIEPSWSVDGKDPFRYLRLLAAMKRKEFVLPPLPPKEYVDPQMWSVLYGIDRTPPEVVAARYAPSSRRVLVDCVDDRAGVAKAMASQSPVLAVTVGAGAVQTKNCTVLLSGGLVAAEGSIRVGSSGVIRLKIPAEHTAALVNGWLFAKVSVPAGKVLKIQPEYPVAVKHTIYRLNAWRYSTIARAPAIFETADSFWYPLRLDGLVAKGNTPVELTLTLSTAARRGAEGAEVEAASQEKAVCQIESIVVFPERLKSEDDQEFGLPTANDCVRTGVVPLTTGEGMDALVAVQCVDKAGNLSAVQVADLIRDNNVWGTQALKLYVPWNNRPGF